MKTIFDLADREEILARVAQLQPASKRNWGKMNPAQMLTHCARVLETAVGVSPRKQSLLGKILMPLFRSSILGEKPFSRNSPTDPSFVASDVCDFDSARKRLIELIDLLVARGSAEAGRATHSFFGKLSGEEWGQLTWKHLDHHLRQFDV